VAALLLAVLLPGGPVLAGCAARSPAPAAAPAAPDSPHDLERLVVTSVPSGLPRMPDARLQPPAGEKNLGDVASYAGNPARERRVLAGYGYRFGWERFWGWDGGPETSVFVDEFRRAAGARDFAADLARNDAAHYRATPHAGTGGLPRGCRLLTVEGADPAVGLSGPAAFAWCTRGVVTVAVTAVTAVSGPSGGASAEVAAVVRAQLRRLPAG
jgi:hypothetical protein